MMESLPLHESVGGAVIRKSIILEGVPGDPVQSLCADREPPVQEAYTVPAMGRKIQRRLTH